MVVAREHLPVYGQPPDFLERATFAAYNCGCGGVRKAVLKDLGPDGFTTGKDYSLWVFNKAEELRAMVPDLFASHAR